MRLTSSRLVSLALAILFASACKNHPSKYNLAHDHKKDELIVTLSEKQSTEDLQASLANKGATVEVLNGRSVLVRYPSGTDLEAAADEIAEQSGVKSVEANVIYRLFQKAPNDPDFSRLYGLKNDGQSGGTAGVDMGAAAAWSQTTGSRSVLVAVIDSGIDYTHADLAANMWTNPGETGLDDQGRDKRTNGIDDDGNGLVDDWRGWDFANGDNDPMDDNSHGTHVAGTIGAVGDNGVGVVGVNWQVSMVGIKVFNAKGETSTDALVMGIEYATRLGVHMSNNSWGGGPASDAIFNAIQAANAKDILFVAAAGNDSDNNDIGEHFPANYDLPNIISVASHNRKDQLSSFSNYGGLTVDVAAPGEEIYSTIPGGSYGIKSGTSMATPHVTGALALMKAQAPNQTGTELRNKLFGSTIQTNALKGRTIFGRIHVANALEEDLTPPSPVKDLSFVRSDARTLTLKWTASGDDGEDGLASAYQFRRSENPIVTEDEWAAATPVSLSNVSTVVRDVTGTLIDLPFNATGYVSARAVDNVGNISEVGESFAFALPTISVLWEESNDNLGNWAAFGTPWSVGTIDGVSVVSDSLGVPYTGNLDKSVVSKDLSFNTSELTLSLRHRYQLEKGFDFGLIELSLDGSTWIELGRVTGASGWVTESYDMRPILGTIKKFRLRLRIKTDPTIHQDGWDIDHLQIIGLKAQALPQR